MTYRLRKGVAVFSMCGEYYIFPSREAHELLPVILAVTPGLAAALRTGEPFDDRGFSAEERKKLERLAAAGYIGVD